MRSTTHMLIYLVQRVIHFLIYENKRKRLKYVAIAVPLINCELEFNFKTRMKDPPIHTISTPDTILRDINNKQWKVDQDDQMTGLTLWMEVQDVVLIQESNINT